MIQRERLEFPCHFQKEASSELSLFPPAMCGTSYPFFCGSASVLSSPHLISLCVSSPNYFPSNLWHFSVLTQMPKTTAEFVIPGSKWGQKRLVKACFPTRMEYPLVSLGFVEVLLTHTHISCVLEFPDRQQKCCKNAAWWELSLLLLT